MLTMGWGCRYFERLFPQLLLACFAFGLEHCAEDTSLKHHFPQGLCGYPFAADIMAYRLDPERTWLSVSSEPLRVRVQSSGACVSSDVQGDSSCLERFWTSSGFWVKVTGLMWCLQCSKGLPGQAEGLQVSDWTQVHLNQYQLRTTEGELTPVSAPGGTY